MVMRPKIGDIRKLYGFLKYEGKPLTIEQMKKAAEEGVLEEFKRSVSR